MPTFKSSLAGLTALTAVLTMTSSANATDFMVETQPYSVELNKTQILRLPASASAVVIGNPSIADVSVHSTDTLFIVGRGFGETNLIVLGANGETIINSNVNVIQKLSTNGVRVYNRSARQTYNCSGNCQPSPVLGDDPDFIGNFTSDVEQINNTEAFSSTSSDVSGDLIGDRNTNVQQNLSSDFVPN